MKKLLKNKYHYIFFSPHFDDAVLSCGGLIARLKKRKVLVVTIFSDWQKGRLSFYASQYLGFCNFKTPEDYFFFRRKEEARASKILGYDCLSLDFSEAIFRFKKRFFLNSFFYNNTRQLLGKINKEDQKIADEIEGRIKRTISKYADSGGKFYFPLGIGNHIDHQLISQIGRNLTDAYQNEIYFFEDFPYVLNTKRKEREDFFLQKDLKPKKIFLTSQEIETKYQAILSYRSQIKPLFGTKENFQKKFFKFYEDAYEEYGHLI